MAARPLPIRERFRRWSQRSKNLAACALSGGFYLPAMKNRDTQEELVESGKRSDK
jgi:hypothetical protein